MPRDVLEEMAELLDEERPDMLVTEVRRLARACDLLLPADAGVEQARGLAEAFVGSEDFEQLDEGVREAWQWVLRALGKSAHVSGNVAVKAATIGSKVVAGALDAATNLMHYAATGKKMLKKGGSGELLKGDEPFTIGDVTFHPHSGNRWRAILPGRYRMIVRYRPNQGTFSCSLEGRPIGGQWDDDDLGYAVQMAFAMIADEPEEDDPRLGRL